MDDSSLLVLPHAGGDEGGLVASLARAGCTSLGQLIEALSSTDPSLHGSGSGSNTGSRGPAGSARGVGGRGGGRADVVVEAIERAVGAARIKEVMQVGREGGKGR